MQQHIIDHSIQIIRLYPHLRNGNHAVQKRHSLFVKLFRLQIQMAAISLCAFQRRKHRAADTHGGIEGPVVLSHDRVHALEAETGYLAELKGVIPQDIHAACAKMVIDLCGGGGGDLEGSQQQHQVTQGAALVVGSDDLLQLCLADAPYLQQPLRFIFQHIQRVRAKPVYDQFSGLAADTLDKP